MRTLLTILLLAGTLLLAACGGDSDDTSTSQDGATATTTTETTSPASGDAERKEKREREAKQEREKEREQEADKDSSAAEPEGTEQQSQPSGSGDGAVDTKSRLFKQSKAYAAATAVCLFQGPEGIARRYKIDSEDPVEIAKGYAEENAPSYARKAARDGCRVGFREFERKSRG